MNSRVKAAFLALPLLLLLAACAQNPVTGKQDFVMMSEAQELSLGRNAEGHLRLINAMYPAGEPGPGQAVKVVE